MINRLRTFGETLHGRLVLATSLPLLALTVLLTANTVLDRQRDVTTRLHQTGHSLAAYLATISDFALYSANEELLTSLAVSSSRIDSVAGIAFLSSTRQILVSTIPAAKWVPLPVASDDGAQLRKGNYLFFEQSVMATGLDIDDYETGLSAANSDARRLGWVVVALDMTTSQGERREILISGVGIALGIMAMAFLLSYLLSRTIVAPIKNLTETVSKAEWGDLSVRAAPASGEELGGLARGINHMIESIEQGQISLQQEVASATNQLQITLVDLRSKNSELEVAMLLADEANAAKSEFLARMSHELRTPLTSIQGFIRLMARADLEVAEKQYCLIIDQAAEQLLRLIDDILEFTRLQAGAMTLEELPFDLSKCLENPIRLLAPTAHGKNIELILDIEPDVPLAVVGDSLRVRQIISNLVANAVKFTEAGYVRVHVTVAGDEAHRCRLAISVEDTGIGISDEQKEHIFQAFIQADTSISRRFGGTGLGLSIVNGLIKLMAGSVRLDSKVGEGSTITVILPLRKQPSVSRPKLTLAAILYDPNERSREALEHTLMRLTDQVESYGDIRGFQAALEVAATGVIIVGLPSTPAVAAQVQGALLPKIREYTDLPLVVVSPLQMLQNRLSVEQEELLKPVTFVSKPVGMEDLSAILTSFDKQRAVSRGIEKPLFGIKALIAEDNEFSRLLLKTLLQRAGCRCYVVTNGREAIDACLAGQFDILLIDVHMPEVNGLEALREIRSLTNANSETPAIVLTADVLRHETESATEAGANQVILKPVDEVALINAIMRLTGRAQRAAIDIAHIRQRVPQERFFTEIERLLDTVCSANGDEATGELREAIHQLVGIAGVFKLGSLEKQARLLHELARVGDYAGVEAVVADLKNEVNTLKHSVG